jgi:hypothetical protein
MKANGNAIIEADTRCRDIPVNCFSRLVLIGGDYRTALSTSAA